MEIKKGGVVSKLLADVKLPNMFRAKQDFPRPYIKPDEIKTIVAREIAKPEIAATIKPGMRIAITAGSRGVANVAIITRAIVDEVKVRGACPFVVTAMGSHGGAVAEGQQKVLASFGITEETMGCPIMADMESIELGVTEAGRKVFFDKIACEADGIIVSCRIKPHNAFRGSIESGICKMMVVGLGNQRGAEAVHKAGMAKMHENLPLAAKVILEKAPILFAIPCIENAYDETCLIEAVPRQNILQREPELLKYAFECMPSLIVGECDVLVIDEIGKNYSGTGTDPNITGTFSNDFMQGGVKVQRTCMLDVSDESDGNCLGTGLASAISKRLYNKIDLEKMYPNIITSTVLKSANIPAVLADDKETVQFCIKTCNDADEANMKIIRIKNSLHIGDIMLSAAYYNDVLAGKYRGVTAIDEPKPLEFDKNGNLLTRI